MHLPRLGLGSVCLSRRLAQTGYSLAVFLITLFVVYQTVIRLGPEPLSTSRSRFVPAVTEDGAQKSHLWGQYSPYFSSPSSISPEIPAKCHYTFAQVLSRHGSRYPTASKSWAYRMLVERMQADVQSFTGPYHFLEDYVYRLGADELTTLGKQELFTSGQDFYTRYNQLASQNLPFIRASGQSRVVRSAEKFAEGYHEANNADKNPPTNSLPRPHLSVIIGEDNSLNNTLSIKSCPSFSRKPNTAVGSDAKMAWAAVFVPAIADRLNEDLPGAQLNMEDTIALMDLCPFETVAMTSSTLSGSLRLSPFCELFSIDEWEKYDYYEALDKYYGHGIGNPLAPSLGVGFVNELIARLIEKPVQDNTCTNRTLDSSPTTFPLDAKIYADFSHDNDMEAIFAALGLYNKTKPLPWTRAQDADQSDGFSASWTVPFAARLYVEKMRCLEDDQEYIRLLVNDRVVPMHSCGMDHLGRCRIADFIQSLTFARGGGRWESCYID